MSCVSHRQKLEIHLTLLTLQVTDVNNRSESNLFTCGYVQNAATTDAPKTVNERQSLKVPEWFASSMIQSCHFACTLLCGCSLGAPCPPGTELDLSRVQGTRTSLSLDHLPGFHRIQAGGLVCFIFSVRLDDVGGLSTHPPGTEISSQVRNWAKSRTPTHLSSNFTASATCLPVLICNAANFQESFPVHSFPTNIVFPRFCQELDSCGCRRFLCSQKHNRCFLLWFPSSGAMQECVQGEVGKVC
jgi:hypothetical protein